jgi:hypothetical protein
MIYPPYPCERRFTLGGIPMKQIDNLLECTRAMHSALEKHDMALLDASCQSTMAAIGEVEAIGFANLPVEDHDKLREVMILNEENYQMAQEGSRRVSALLEAVRLNHR